MKQKGTDFFSNEKVEIKFFGNNIPGSSGKYLFDRAKSEEEAKKNIELLMQACGSDKLSFMNQKHTNIVKLIDQTNYTDSSFVCDAQVTKEKSIALLVQTADCVPVLLFDEDNGIIGAAHAGWRGAIGGVVEETIKAMRSLGADKISAVIGPCVRQESYEVDPDFCEKFCEDDPANKNFFILHPDNPKKYLFNPPGYVARKLEKEQVVKITDCGINTYTDESLFSFRRYTHIGGTYGSNISLICLKSFPISTLGPQDKDLPPSVILGSQAEDLSPSVILGSQAEDPDKDNKALDSRSLRNNEGNHRA